MQASSANLQTTSIKLSARHVRIGTSSVASILSVSEDVEPWLCLATTLEGVYAAKPSRTALRVALRRAAHQVYDGLPRVLDDPIAVPILGAEYLPELQKSATKLQKPFSVAMRAHLVVRSRYAEDRLARAVAEDNVRQYVLLGAGLDTFAHRNPHAGLRVFEVDHPATQQWKRELLATTALSEPVNLKYVPVDFEMDSLPQQLQIAGHDAGQPTVFAMLGVVPYLTLEAFRATVALVAAQPAGSAVIFDYGQPRSALPFFEQLAHDSLAERVALAGEPFRLFLTPAEMALELKGFREIEDLGSAALNERYLGGRSDGLQMRGTAGRLLSATV